MCRKKQKQYYYITKDKSDIHVCHLHHDAIREKAGGISLSQEKQQKQTVIKKILSFSFAL
jgi:hypothetical protein